MRAAGRLSLPKVNEPTITEFLLMSSGVVEVEPGNLKFVNTPWLYRKPVREVPELEISWLNSRHSFLQVLT
jgi:hypothetical protein